LDADAVTVAVGAAIRLFPAGLVMESILVIRQIAEMLRIIFHS
jgi:hypothetical protein